MYEALIGGLFGAFARLAGERYSQWRNGECELTMLDIAVFCGGVGLMLRLAAHCMRGE